MQALIYFGRLFEKVDLGVEYTYGKRETFSNLEGKLSRINLLGRYNF